MSSASNQEDFPISPNLGTGLRLFFYSQFFVTPQCPTHSFAKQTVIVTGANSGLGLEAAQHFYRLHCDRLILAVRTIAKAKRPKSIFYGATRSGPIRKPSRYGPSTSRAPRRHGTAAVGRFVNNAGINPPEWKLYEDYEQAVQVNVLNTFILALSLLPKLEASAALAEKESPPHLVIVSSEAHRLTKFPEINAPDLYAKLNEKSSFSQQPRYQVTKLMEVLFTRELVARLGASTRVIVNIVNPGLCTSNLERNSGEAPVVMRLVRRLLDRTTEVGSRTLVLGASAPASSHGEFQSDGVNQDVEAWTDTEVGQRAQKKVFEQTLRILEVRRPGIACEAGLREV
ncbi:short-chain dehydrogenase/reductase [Penicillium samsonianum]|uniref:short-chain dehydrogenase/reductase n=1 Tax=Penicillium samsonianum TaxID=1882272 RepID=UPI0025488560|nr:short-chain dehydrogenase/reductase [Penicillium samsonianum]KAJ6150019.1 short-chain dehydrogenase/reductase [Penicillium samsonianum]